MNLWKNRSAYRRINKAVADLANIEHIDLIDLGFPTMYQSEIGNQMGVRLILFRASFEAVGRGKVSLYSEKANVIIDESLNQASRLLNDLDQIVKGEPQYYILFVGRGVAQKRSELEEDWINLTARVIRR